MIADVCTYAVIVVLLWVHLRFHKLFSRRRRRNEPLHRLVSPETRAAESLLQAGRARTCVQRKQICSDDSDSSNSACHDDEDGDKLYHGSSKTRQIAPEQFEYCEVCDTYSIVPLNSSSDSDSKPRRSRQDYTTTICLNCQQRKRKARAPQHQRGAKGTPEYFSWLHQTQLEMLERDESSRLCKACLAILLPDEDTKRHHNRENLGRSAFGSLSGEGCSVCKFLCRHRVESMRTAHIRVHAKRGIVEYSQVSPGKTSGSVTHFEVYADGASDSSVPVWITSRALQSEPLAPANIEKIKAWMESCETFHDLCVQSSNCALPTRLIDVSGEQPRLIHSRATQPRSQSSDFRYIALSHCWGRGEQTLTTRTTNLAERERGMRLSEIPALFLDAIQVTKTLGVPFLWIDSLCIVQDSPEDWSAECQRMGDYYANAWLTISALEASNSSEPFLTSRKQPPCAIADPTRSLYMRARLPLKANIFKEAILNHRGWALQERLLSTRILHFTKYGLFWECQTLSTQETSTIEYRGTADWYNLTTSEGQDFKRLLSDFQPSTDAGKGAFALWKYLVRQGSIRSLTYAKDWLPSMAGLAALVARHTKSECLAGIWSDDPSGLLWLPDDEKFNGHKCIANGSADGHIISENSAPSWSWACVSGPIKYSFKGDQEDCPANIPLILGHESTKPSAGSFEIIPAVCITLRAKIINVSLQKAYQYPHLVYDSNKRNLGHGYLDDSSVEVGFTSVKAIWITQRSNRLERCTYFLLVERSLVHKGTWRRIGVATVQHRFNSEGVPVNEKGESEEGFNEGFDKREKIRLT